jgi:hypothetical protein
LVPSWGTGTRRDYRPPRVSICPRVLTCKYLEAVLAKTVWLGWLSIVVT